MKGSDLFIKCLEDEGVEYIFGLPGEETNDLMISLLDSFIIILLFFPYRIKTINCILDYGDVFGI
jgi:thiamine pyrophosphate-dependent acetolactate synthase large subunit-like protein